MACGRCFDQRTKYKHERNDPGDLSLGDSDAEKKVKESKAGN